MDVSSEGQAWWPFQTQRGRLWGERQPILRPSIGGYWADFWESHTGNLRVTLASPEWLPKPSHAELEAW